MCLPWRPKFELEKEFLIPRNNKVRIGWSSWSIWIILVSLEQTSCQICQLTHFTCDLQKLFEKLYFKQFVGFVGFWLVKPHGKTFSALWINYHKVFKHFIAICCGVKQFNGLNFYTQLITFLFKYDATAGIDKPYSWWCFHIFFLCINIKRAFKKWAIRGIEGIKMRYISWHYFLTEK